MNLGIIGLGRMGGSLARLAMGKGHRIAGYSKDPGLTQGLAKEGLDPAFSLAELVGKLPAPRLLVIYVPHGEPTDATIAELKGLLQPGDLVADGGNSHWKDSVRHYEELNANGVAFLMSAPVAGSKGRAAAPASWSGAMPMLSPRSSRCSVISPFPKGCCILAPQVPAIL